MSFPELLLISPPDYETREFRGAQPLGIAYLAGSLRAVGIPAQLLDANVGGPMPFDQFAARVEDFVSSVRQRGGRPVVGVSVVSQVIATAAALAERIKAIEDKLGDAKSQRAKAERDRVHTDRLGRRVAQRRCRRGPRAVRGRAAARGLRPGRRGLQG
jgi:hypothetical protein